MKNKKEKIVLITGGCGFLGWEHAKSLIELSFYKVIIVDNSLRKIKERNNEIIANNLNIEIFKCNIEKKKEIKQILIKILKKYKKIDILINNASIDFVPKSKIKKNNDFVKFNLGRWEKEIKVGLTGAFLFCQLVGKIMKKNNYGIILNIASDLSVIAPNQSLYKHLNTIKPVTYSIIKSGIHGLTLYLASLWAKNGIRVNTLSPGGVFNNQDKLFIKKIESVIPMNRMANKNEYYGAIKFLCTDESSYMTGQNIIIDGGRTII